MTQLATRQAHLSHFHTLVQAFFSACAKMCVRELRKTDTANVSVFYLSFSSTIFAAIALTVSWLVGGAGLVIPTAPVDWGLFALVGKPVSELSGCALGLVHRTDETAPAVRHPLGGCSEQELHVSCQQMQGRRLCTCIDASFCAAMQLHTSMDAKWAHLHLHLHPH